jgi:hypothetical protein
VGQLRDWPLATHSLDRLHFTKSQQSDLSHILRKYCSLPSSQFSSRRKASKQEIAMDNTADSLLTTSTRLSMFSDDSSLELQVGQTVQSYPGDLTIISSSRIASNIPDTSRSHLECAHKQVSFECSIPSGSQVSLDVDDLESSRGVRCRTNQSTPMMDGSQQSFSQSAHL